MMLIKMIFYVLKKKMIWKINSKNANLDSLWEIYSAMINVYLSWQNVITVQMNAENPQFFGMLHRNKNYNPKNDRKTIKEAKFKRPQSFMFASKPQYIVTKHVNIEYKLYSFFKQLLRMTINSLIIVVSSVPFDKVNIIIDSLRTAELLMKNFQQHMFPIEKMEFYLIKCQILQILEENAQMCLNFQVKYEFPIGLFQLIYRNLGKWKDGKVSHYVNLLLKMIVSSMKNRLLDIKNAYILANEINFLIQFIRRRSSGFDRRSSMNGRRGILETKSTIRFQSQNKRQQTNLGQSPHRKNTDHQEPSYSQLNKKKNKLLTILKMILTEIQNFIHTRKQVEFIIRTYMGNIVGNYKNKKVFDKQLADDYQIIEQIPVLLEKQNRKSKKSKKISPTKDDSGFNAINKKSKSPFKFDDFQMTKKQSHQTHDQDHQYQTSNIATSKYNGLKTQNNKIILKNIMNVKYRKKLSLSGTNRNQKKNETLGITKDSLRTSHHSSDEQKLNLPHFINHMIKKTFSEVAVFKPNLDEPVPFMFESQSDSDNQLEYQFETKRRQEILQINNKFYKQSNSNYINKKYEDLSKSGSQFMKDKSAWNESENDGDDSNDDQNQSKSIFKLNQKNKKLSQDLQFQEIKLLDEVIHQKIFEYLDMEIDSIINLKQNYHSDSIKQKQSSLPQTQMITNYQQTMKNTEHLKACVDQLNRKRKLIIDKFNYQVATLKAREIYSEKNQNLDVFHAGILKDLQNLYNTKNNLTDKAEKCVKLYRKLLKIDERVDKRDLLTSALQKYGKVYKKYNQNLSIIGQVEEQNSILGKQEQIPIIQFIVKNRPISLLQQQLKIRQSKNSFSNKNNTILDQAASSSNKIQKKDIALRQTFYNLRNDITKTQFGQNNNLMRTYDQKSQNWK